jgi:hypothetical protein
MLVSIGRPAIAACCEAYRELICRTAIIANIQENLSAKLEQIPLCFVDI